MDWSETVLTIFIISVTVLAVLLALFIIVLRKVWNFITLPVTSRTSKK